MYATITVRVCKDCEKTQVNEEEDYCSGCQAAKNKERENKKKEYEEYSERLRAMNIEYITELVTEMDNVAVNYNDDGYARNVTVKYDDKIRFLGVIEKHYEKYGNPQDKYEFYDESEITIRKKIELIHNKKIDLIKYKVDNIGIHAFTTSGRKLVYQFKEGEKPDDFIIVSKHSGAVKKENKMTKREKHPIPSGWTSYEESYEGIYITFKYLDDGLYKTNADGLPYEYTNGIVVNSVV